MVVNNQSITIHTEIIYNQAIFLDYKKNFLFFKDENIF